MIKKIKKCPFCGENATIRKKCTNHFIGEKYFVCCTKCKGKTRYYNTENEAIKAWNCRIKPKTEVIEHIMTVTDIDRNKYVRSEYLCGACKKKVLGGDEYCSHCGEQLDWRHL